MLCDGGRDSSSVAVCWQGDTAGGSTGWWCPSLPPPSHHTMRSPHPHTATVCLTLNYCSQNIVEKKYSTDIMRDFIFGLKIDQYFAGLERSVRADWLCEKCQILHWHRRQSWSHGQVGIETSRQQNSFILTPSQTSPDILYTFTIFSWEQLQLNIFFFNETCEFFTLINDYRFLLWTRSRRKKGS